MKYIYLFAAILFGSMAFSSANAESTPAENTPAPQCTAQNDGITHCMAGRMCECTHFHGSLMKGTPEGYRWDCGIKRPNCLDYNKIEEVKPYDGPESVGEHNH